MNFVKTFHLFVPIIYREVVTKLNLSLPIPILTCLKFLKKKGLLKEAKRFNYIMEYVSGMDYEEELRKEPVCIKDKAYGDKDLIPTDSDKIMTAFELHDKLEEKYIILDFSGSTEEYIAMSKMCDRIFLVQRSDCITEATVKAFEWELEVLSEAELSGKIHKVYTGVLREHLGDKFLEINLEGELGEKIKQILQEEGLFD